MFGRESTRIEDAAEPFDLFFVLLNDLGMTFLEIVEVILHHVYFTELLRDAVFHLISLCLELSRVVAQKIKLVSDKVKEISEAC